MMRSVHLFELSTCFGWLFWSIAPVVHYLGRENTYRFINIRPNDFSVFGCVVSFLFFFISRRDT